MDLKCWWRLWSEWWQEVITNSQWRDRKMILNVNDRTVMWNHRAWGPTAHTPHWGASLCYDVATWLVILMTPKHQAKLKLCSAHSMKILCVLCVRRFNKHFIKTISHEKFIILSFGKLMCVVRSFSDLLWLC